MLSEHFQYFSDHWSSAVIINLELCTKLKLSFRWQHFFPLFQISMNVRQTMATVMATPLVSIPWVRVLASATRVSAGMRSTSVMVSGSWCSPAKIFYFLFLFFFLFLIIPFFLFEGKRVEYLAKFFIISKEKMKISRSFQPIIRFITLDIVILFRRGNYH